MIQSAVQNLDRKIILNDLHANNIGSLVLLGKRLRIYTGVQKIEARSTLQAKDVHMVTVLWCLDIANAVANLTRKITNAPSNVANPRSFARSGPLL